MSKTIIRGSTNYNLECEQCKKKNLKIIETQEHILNCMKISDRNEKFKIPKYEEMFGTNVKNKLEIAKIITEHIKIRDELSMKNK